MSSVIHGYPGNDNDTLSSIIVADVPNLLASLHALQ